MSARLRGIIALMLFASVACAQSTNTCGPAGIWLQILGSGGPELTDSRASSGYLIWQEGKARILVDMGGGSMFRYEQSGARIEDLDLILLTHLHVDHSADLPSLLKAAFFTDRTRDLPIYGPTGNSFMPSTQTFVNALFGAKGAYRYLSGFLGDTERFRLNAHDVNASANRLQSLEHVGPYKIAAIPVHHGAIPSIAWRVDIAGKRLVFSGDTNNAQHTLDELASRADIFIAHHAIPESSDRVAHELHMTPSEIGRIAATANVKHLVLSHRMNRTLHREDETIAIIKKLYSGSMEFANDLQCFKL